MRSASAQPATAQGSVAAPSVSSHEDSRPPTSINRPYTFHTPVIDGVINPGEYGSDVDGQNQQTSGAQVWHMTWDATNLYIGIANANINEGAVVYIDNHPLTPINGGSNADGTIVGQPYDGANFAALQFRADFVTYFHNGYREYRTADGANGWSGPTSGFGSYADNGGTNTRELAIPWTAINAGGRPASFAWFGYITSNSGFVYGQVPTANPGANIGTAARYERYYIVNDTSDSPNATYPFAHDSYVFNSATNETNFRRDQRLGLHHELARPQHYPRSGRRWAVEYRRLPASGQRQRRLRRSDHSGDRRR